MQVEIIRNTPFSHTNFLIIGTNALFADISPFAFRLYCAYASYANNQRQSWPSRKTLAKSLKRTVDTIDRANLELETAGWIKIESQVRDNGSQTVNVITLIDPMNLSENVAEGGRRNAAGGAANIRLPELKPYELRETVIDTVVSITEKKKRGRPALVRKTEGIDKLFVAFRSKRFPNAVAERYNPAELAANQTVLMKVLDGGITPDQFAFATQQAMERWDSPAMVTVRSVARNLSSLCEPEPARRSQMTSADRRADDARRFSEERLLREYSYQNQREMEALNGESY